MPSHAARPLTRFADCVVGGSLSPFGGTHTRAAWLCRFPDTAGNHIETTGIDTGVQSVKVLGAVLVVLVLAAVVFVAANPSEDVAANPPGDPGSSTASPAATAQTVPTTNLVDVYDPFRAGEALPSGYRQVLGRDAIAPIYEPSFVPAAATPWDDDTLVVGVAIDGEAKAYPVSLLNRREMVIDSIAGIPVLVTW